MQCDLAESFLQGYESHWCQSTVFHRLPICLQSPHRVCPLRGCTIYKHLESINNHPHNINHSQFILQRWWVMSLFFFCPVVIKNIFLAQNSFSLLQGFSKDSPFTGRIKAHGCSTILSKSWMHFHLMTSLTHCQHISEITSWPWAGIFDWRETMRAFQVQ